MCQDTCKLTGGIKLNKVDVIIVGSGIAGLQLAYELSKQLKVFIITKNRITNSNSYRAQGGIAAAVSIKDDPYLHFHDTIMAGEGHGVASAVLELVNEGKQVIKELIEAGAPFDFQADGELALGLEGAHSEARILHCGGDQTGKYLIEFFIEKLMLSPNITWVQEEMVIDLVLNKAGSCIGVKTKNQAGNCITYLAPHTVLATGGAGWLYPNTSNDSTITGDGIALAYRASAKITDLEFFQFHPTLLTINGKAIGLVSEAVRGAGAILVNDHNERIMQHVHPLQDLAPRHIVTYELLNQLTAGNRVYLDITNVKDFTIRFPTISTMCLDHHIDLNTEKLPVSPGAHFIMGGIVIDKWGASSVQGLYAIGEVAASGVHGANRLASNSLLEGLVYGKRLGTYLLVNGINRSGMDFTPVLPKRQALTQLPFAIQELQTSMLRSVGIIRNHNELATQLSWLESWGIDPFSQIESCDQPLIQTYYMWIVARLLTESALLRTESRGTHIRSDFLDKDEHWLQKRIIHFQTNDRMEITYDQYSKTKGPA